MSAYVWKDGVGTKVHGKQPKPTMKRLGNLMDAMFMAALVAAVFLGWQQMERNESEQRIRSIIEANGGVFVPPPPPVLGMEG